MAAEDRRATFLRGLEAYRAGQHYEAHEHWEELWQDEPDEARRRLLQALIQVASAIHKAMHDVGPRGSLRLLERAGERLRGLPAVFMAVDVEGLRTDAASLSHAIARRIDAKGHCRLPACEVPPLVLIGEPGPWPLAASAPSVPELARSTWFEAGLRAYREREFFEAHERWEQLWRDEHDDDHKRFLQGLIQVAAAMHKIQVQHKPEPALRLLQRALLRLSQVPADYCGLALGRLIREARRAQELLASLAAADGAESTTLPDELVPTIMRVSS